MSLLTQGLPPRFFTRWRAVAVGLFIAGAFIVGNEAYVKLKYYFSEATAPACYGTPQLARTRPIPARGVQDRHGHSIDDRLAAEDRDRLTLAQRVCTASACGRDEWQAYRSAIFWYVSSRTMHTSRLYRDYGDAGLARAREIYGTAFDRQIEDGLRKRYAKGIFRLNDFKQDRDAMAILILKGGEALRPCRCEPDGHSGRCAGAVRAFPPVSSEKISQSR
jgi:hypothetical protein